MLDERGGSRELDEAHGDLQPPSSSIAIGAERMRQIRWRWPLLLGADGNDGGGLFSQARMATVGEWPGQRCGGGRWESGGPWNQGFEPNFWSLPKIRAEPHWRLENEVQLLKTGSGPILGLR
jgi:hypothetical protein